VITLLLSVRISIRWGVAYRIRRVTFPAIAGRFVLGSKHLPAPLPGWDRVSDTVLTTLPPIAGRLEAGGPRFRSLYLLSHSKFKRSNQTLNVGVTLPQLPLAVALAALRSSLSVSRSAGGQRVKSQNAMRDLSVNLPKSNSRGGQQVCTKLT